MNGTYDTLLVATSFFIAVLASYAAIELSLRTHNNKSTAARRLWHMSGALAAGTGIWAMHFVGMLAFRLPIPLGYDSGITLLSWLLPILVSAVALWRLGGAALSWRVRPSSWAA